MPVQGGRGWGGGENKRSLFFFLALRYVTNVTASIVTLLCQRKRGVCD